jgi:hypothetical protein
MAVIFSSSAAANILHRKKKIKNKKRALPIAIKKSVKKSKKK